MTDNNKQQYIDFEAYERVAEPHKRERASAWRTAIGQLHCRFRHLAMAEPPIP